MCHRDSSMTSQKHILCYFLITTLIIFRFKEASKRSISVEVSFYTGILSLNLHICKITKLLVPIISTVWDFFDPIIIKLPWIYYFKRAIMNIILVINCQIMTSMLSYLIGLRKSKRITGERLTNGLDIHSPLKRFWLPSYGEWHYLQ